MFFYRAWAGNDGRYSQSSNSGFDLFATQYAYHRWGYGALMLITIAASLVLNGLFLGSFCVNWAKQKEMPHMGLFILAIRDLLVTLILAPIAIDWFVVHVGAFGSGEIMCRAAGFFDFTLATEYPYLLIALTIILYTRRYPKLEDTLQDDDLIMDRIPEPVMVPSVSMSSSRRTPSRPSSRPSSRPPSKPPSVVGSVDGYRRPTPGSGPGFRPQRPVMMNTTSTPKRPGSVTGSIEGRLAQSGNRSRTNFAASSPLQEVDEEDLWDAASLDYPGRNSPNGWEFIEEDPRYFDEPRYHTWHYWLAGFTWLLAMGIGIPAAMLVKYQPTTSQSGRPSLSRPGCFLHVDPFKDAGSYTINDPGFNFNLAFVIIVYMLPVVVLLAMICLIYCHKGTDNGKFKRHVKMIVFLSLVFLVSRSPMDILQLKGLLEAIMGFKQLNVLAYELEYEILLVWSTYIPTVLNPIIYFCFCSEYRQGSLKVIRTICGCQKAKERKEEEKLNRYREEEILHSRSTVSRTQVSNML